MWPSARFPPGSSGWRRRRTAGRDDEGVLLVAAGVLALLRRFLLRGLVDLVHASVFVLVLDLLRRGRGGLGLVLRVVRHGSAHFVDGDLQTYNEARRQRF